MRTLFQVEKFLLFMYNKSSSPRGRSAAPRGEGSSAPKSPYRYVGSSSSGGASSGPRRTFSGAGASFSRPPRPSTSGGFSRSASSGSSYSSRSSSSAPRSYSSTTSYGGSSSRSSSNTSGASGGFSSPSRGYAPRSGGSSFSGSRGGYQSRGGSRGGSRFGGQRIDISKFVQKAEITEKMDVFIPEHAFADFKIEERLKANIISKGYVTPTPIQDRAIPHVLKGSDVVGIANTGTGKTAAFLVPLIDKVLKNPKDEYVLVVVPTRELAIQIQQELKEFTPKLDIYSVCCVGGAPIGKQISELRYHNNFIIGTPGRIKDLIERKRLDLSRFKTVVLDEADRMLDMGFIHDMKYFMAFMPKDRQTLFFSATLSPEIEGLINAFLNKPVMISVKTQATAKNVDQDIVRIRPGENKTDVLAELLKQPGFTKVIVFGKTKYGVERLSNQLVMKGIKSESIHGDKNHSRRVRALDLFKKDGVQVLVATDVAARGLDISGITHVINYDIPMTYDDYVHRIGRTGRGGKTGKALTFVE